MRCLKDTKVTPPGNWSYTQPETGFAVVGGSYRDLLRKVKDHRSSNNIPVGINYTGEIQDQICSRIDSVLCSPCNENLQAAEAISNPTGVGKKCCGKKSSK